MRIQNAPSRSNSPPSPLPATPGSPAPGFCYHSQFFLVLKLYNNETVQHRAVLLYLTSFAWKNILEIHASLYTLELVLVGGSFTLYALHSSIWAASHIYCNFAWVLTFQSPIKFGKIRVDVCSQLPWLISSEWNRSVTWGLWWSALMANWIESRIT